MLARNSFLAANEMLKRKAKIGFITANSISFDLELRLPKGSEAAESPRVAESKAGKRKRESNVIEERDDDPIVINLSSEDDKL